MSNDNVVDTLIVKWNTSDRIDQIRIITVPEPTTGFLFSCAFALAGILIRRSRLVEDTVGVTKVGLVICKGRHELCKLIDIAAREADQRCRCERWRHKESEKCKRATEKRNYICNCGK